MRFDDAVVAGDSMVSESGSAASVAHRRDSHEKEALLEIRDLSIRFDTRHGQVHAVNGVDISVAPGEVFALVGESGSGKSVSMLSVMGLLETPPARVSGSIRLSNVELTGLSRRRL